MQFAIRMVGNSWYKTHDESAIASSRDLNEATFYDTEDAATTAAMLFTMAHPQWMRKVRVQSVRETVKPVIRCLNPQEKRSDRRIYKRLRIPHMVTC